MRAVLRRYSCWVLSQLASCTSTSCPELKQFLSLETRARQGLGSELVSKIVSTTFKFILIF